SQTANGRPCGRKQLGRLLREEVGERCVARRRIRLRQHHWPPFCTKLRTNSSAFSSSTSSISSRIESTSSSSFSLRSATSLVASTSADSSVDFLVLRCCCSDIPQP